MRKNDQEDSPHRPLALKLLGHAQKIDRRYGGHEIPVYRAKMVENSGSMPSYSIEYGAFHLNGHTKSVGDIVLADIDSMLFPNGNEKLSRADQLGIVKDELFRIWGSIKREEKDGMALIVMESENARGPEYLFTFRRPKQQELL